MKIDRKMPARTVSSSSPKKMSSERKKGDNFPKSDDLPAPETGNPETSKDSPSGMDAVKLGLQELQTLVVWGCTEGRNTVKSYVKKNYKKSEWLKDGYDLDSDSIRFFTIISNAAIWFSGTKFFKQLRPLFMLLVWNGITPFLPEWFIMTFARLIFIAKNAGVMWFLFTIYQAIKLKIEDGEMEQQITIEKQEWTNEGSMETVQDLQDIGSYDMDQIWAFVKQQGIQLAIVSFLHMKYEYTTPLVFSSILGVMAIMDLPLYKIYIKGVSVEDDETLKRPWKNAQDFGEQWKVAMQRYMGQGPAADAAAGPNKKKISTKSLKAKGRMAAAEQKKNF